MKAFGLIAGLTYTEEKRLTPGEIMDLYIYRQRYDDMEHGVRRAKRVCED